jgi:hypothetical protein
MQVLVQIQSRAPPPWRRSDSNGVPFPLPNPTYLPLGQTLDVRLLHSSYCAESRDRRAIPPIADCLGRKCSLAIPATLDDGSTTRLSFFTTCGRHDQNDVVLDAVLDAARVSEPSTQEGGAWRVREAGD